MTDLLPALPLLNLNSIHTMKRLYTLIQPHYVGSVLAPAGAKVELTDRQALAFRDKLADGAGEAIPEKPLEVSTRTGAPEDPSVTKNPNAPALSDKDKEADDANKDKGPSGPPAGPPKAK